MKAFKMLRGRFSNLRLIIAPRHIERSKKILEQLKSSGLTATLSTNPVFRQKNNAEVGKEKQEGLKPDVLVLDQLGVLRNLYRIADLVFMGGSLIPHGGQNPIEPARFSKAVVHGPNVFNFHKLYHQLDHDGGALRISAPDELSSAAAELLATEGRRHEMGQKAFQIINRLRGASKRQAGWILTFLAGRRSQERIEQHGKHEELLPASGRGQTA